MFSVIIPLYNKAPYINKAIESVLLQTFQNFELIVINDGSTDGSLEKIEKFKDDRLKVITQLNTGVSIARNNGVKLAKFDYIALLDADDWWSEFFLQEMKDLIFNFPDAGIYGSNYYTVKNNVNRPAYIGVDSSFFAGYINYFNVYARTFWVPINCSFVIVRKSIFHEERGFEPMLKFGEDFDLWARIALKNKVGYINKFLAYSNQDVELSNRAINDKKLWKKEEHIIFNIKYLEEKQQKIPDLKFLLDGLKVRSLSEYYLKGIYKEEVENILALINWQEQPFLYIFIYNWPKVAVKFYFLFKYYASKIKNRLYGLKLK